MTEPIPTDDLTVLGSTVRHPVEHVECFPAPDHVSVVRFETGEVASICPVTGQPDISHLLLEYGPHERCVESKSLKLYLWGFRDRPVFAEGLAAEIAGEIMARARPHWVRATIRQQPRGGIILEAVSEVGRVP